jgi:uncharacterized protein
VATLVAMLTLPSACSIDCEKAKEMSAQGLH